MGWSEASLPSWGSLPLLSPEKLPPSILPACSSLPLTCPAPHCPAGAPRSGPWGRASTAPRRAVTSRRHCPQCPAPASLSVLPHCRPPLLASPLAVGTDVYTPEMALLKMTFNQSWNYRADGCKPRNQSRAAGRAWQGPQASSGRQSSAPASHIKARRTQRSRKRVHLLSLD